MVLFFNFTQSSILENLSVLKLALSVGVRDVLCVIPLFANCRTVMQHNNYSDRCYVNMFTRLFLCLLNFNKKVILRGKRVRNCRYSALYASHL